VQQRNKKLFYAMFKITYQLQDFWANFRELEGVKQSAAFFLEALIIKVDFDFTSQNN